jgi:hypothetical protein
MKNILPMLVLAGFVCTAGAQEQAVLDAGTVSAAIRSFKTPKTELAKAVDWVLANTDKADGFLMFQAGVTADRLERLEDAGFLSHAGAMRVQYDAARFLMPENKKTNLLLGLSASRMQFQRNTLPKLVRNPSIYPAIVRRLEKWDIGTVEGYGPTPGESYDRVSPKDEAAARQFAKEEVMVPIREFSRQLQNPEFAARIQRELNANEHANTAESTKVLKKAMEKQEKSGKYKEVNGVFIPTE